MKSFWAGACAGGGAMVSWWACLRESNAMAILGAVLLSAGVGLTGEVLREREAERK